MFIPIYLLVLNILNSVYGNRNEESLINVINNVVSIYNKEYARHNLVNLNCGLSLHQEYCRLKCPNNPSICIKGGCYCIGSTGLPSEYTNSKAKLSSIESASDEESLYDRHPSNLGHKLNLRHHIAHFCPNLQIARQCIRKCIVEGKPAFCGKDHTCYCGYAKQGNKYGNKVNASQMYAEFKDLYKKYFGPDFGKEDDDEYQEVVTQKNSREDEA